MLIGREEEIKLLQEAVKANESRFIAVYGRRRVGKTFLIRETFGYRFTFQHAGLSDSGLSGQLFAFTASLKEAGFSADAAPRNWLEAFELLKDLIRRSTEQRKVIFIDELSWMDTPRCDLMTALESFWNGWASARRDIVLVICTSATSWMLSKVVHNKGGLYNRLTDQIHLRPFTLAECEDYVKKAGMVFPREQILQCYMIMGGIPYYWGLLKKGRSLAQNIDNIFFADNAPLKEEFRYLYASIFKKPEPYIRIIRELGQKKSGLTREDIIAATGLTNSGSLTVKLEELECCGFIRKYYAFGMKKKNAVYQLTDCFSLFYFAFMENATGDEHFWSNQINTPRINTWTGLAFERVCLEHIGQIKKKLGISGVLTHVNAWHCSADEEKGLFGSQIDLLIVRRDQVINVCEMKYSGFEYTVTKRDDMDLRRKIHDLIAGTGTKYAIHPTLITCYGLAESAYAGNIQAVVVMDDLFETV